MQNLFSAVLALLVIGCSNQSDQGTATNDPEPDHAVPITSTGPDDKWAADLLSEAGEWAPVTRAAVPAHQRVFGLCRATIPGVDDHGPHNAYSFDARFGEIQDQAPKSPANQFIVNPVGSDLFYDTSGPIDQVASVPPPLPVGTVIIKEKYDQIEDANKRINAKAFGVMIKRELGYDTEHGNWEYAYIEVDHSSTITAAMRGKLDNCIDCHANRKHTDYVFRNYPLMSKTK